MDVPDEVTQEAECVEALAIDVPGCFEGGAGLQDAFHHTKGLCAVPLDIEGIGSARQVHVMCRGPAIILFLATAHLVGPEAAFHEPLVAAIHGQQDLDGFAGGVLHFPPGNGAHHLVGIRSPSGGLWFGGLEGGRNEQEGE